MKVSDGDFGPQIDIHSSALGNIQSSMKIYTDKKSLKALGEMFTKASQLEYSEQVNYLA